MYPSAAGVRLYLGRAFGLRFALIATFAYMCTVVVVIAADAFLIGAAIQHTLHQPRALAFVWILVLLLVATAANLRGITLAGRVQSIVTYTVLAATTIVSLIAVMRPGRAYETPFALFGNGALSGFQAIAFAVFLFAAFEWVTTTAEEARRPQVITRALFVAPFMIWGAAALFALGLAHLVPKSVADASAYPQLLLGRAALGAVGESVMLAVTILTAINTFNGGFLVASRFLYAAARESNLPRSFARLNLRAVPWLSVVVLAAASAVVAGVVFITGNWLILVAVGAALESSVFALACVALLRLRRREPTATRPFRLRAAPWLAGGGAVLFTGLALAAGFSDPENPSAFSLVPALIVAVLTAVSWGYVRWVVPRLRRAAAARAAAARASGAKARRRPTRPAAAPEGEN